MKAAPVMEAPMSTMKPTSAVPPACRNRGGKREGQHSRKHETEDLLQGRLLPDRLHGCEVGPPWRPERGSARFTWFIVTPLSWTVGPLEVASTHSWSYAGGRS